MARRKKTIPGTGVPPVMKDHGQDPRGTGVPPVMKDHGQDPHATGGVVFRYGAYLPHLTMAGGVYFVTFRLGDSLAAPVLEAWKEERTEIVKRAAQAGRALTVAEEDRLRELYSERIERYLDAGHGACWMKDRRIAGVVREALQHFDGERYDLLAWCIMPNHVHVVVRPREGRKLEDILHSWKSFTSKEANKIAGRTGTFWQAESYDHLMRDQKDLWQHIKYTYENPDVAGVSDWPWRGWREDIEEAFS